MSNGRTGVPGAFAAVLGGGLILGAILFFGVTSAVAGTAAVAAAGALYILCGALVIARAGAFYTSFGFANVLTLARLVIASVFAGLAVQFCLAGAAADRAMWGFTALAAAALVIDGLDGFAARRLGQSSSFGARFDMEVDALLILVLSVIAFAIGKAGLWVIAGGLLRYLYVLAACISPALSRPLAPSWRRKAIAVIQGTALTALLAPVVQPPLSTAAALIALVLLVYSFAVDIAAQVRGQ